MIKIKFWQVDAFTNKPFKGNPAAVFILEKSMDETLMHKIAIEMNLSETAFILIRKDSPPLIRWFTPMHEIDLCGHATLASAQVYFSEIDTKATEVTFDTKFVGPITVKKDNTFLTMDFPSRPGKEIRLNSIPNYVIKGLSQEKPIYARKSRDLMLVYSEDRVIYQMKPNFHALLDYQDSIIVTAKSSNSEYDFVSRFFCSKDGLLEDPVTGSAHCTLAPYWSEKLEKNEMRAYQASKRGGELLLKLQQDRLKITGEGVTLMRGTFFL